MGQSDKAKDYFTKSLNLKKSILEISESNNNLSLLYLEKGDLDQASQLCEKNIANRKYIL